MSHFKYEIDERNLRLQLKAMEVPFSEEAWQKFESCSSTLRHGADERVTGRFHVSLNRNVILPVVFGCVIVLFSLLLLNFVNIKNPNPAREERAAAVTPPPAPAQAEEVQKALPARQSQPVAVAKDSVAAVPTPEATAPAEKAPEHPAAAAPEKVLPPPVAKTSEAPAETKRPETGRVTNNNNTSSSTDVLPKKKLKKREVIMETAPGEEEQAPPPVSEPAPGN